MINKSFSLKLLFSQNRKEIHIFCSFLASISPGSSANFSCSSRKSSGVVLSVKTLTVVLSSSISLLRIMRSSSASFSLLQLLTQLLHPDPCSFYQSPQNHFYWANGARFSPRWIGLNITAFVKRSKFWGLFRSSHISTMRHFCLFWGLLWFIAWHFAFVLRSVCRRERMSILIYERCSLI